MITNPKTFFEQFQNFIEESGLQIKKFKSNLSNYFTKSEAIDTFLGKTDQAESAKKSDEAIKATQDASGNVITATYATKAELSNKLDASSAFTKAQADNLYLGKSAKATSASVADTAGSATKATQDAKGNVIDSTYLTKTDASNTYLVKTAKAASAITADTATKASQDADGNVIANTYVKTINGQTPTGGNVTVDIGVTSVNGQSGAVTITPPDPYVLPAATGSSLGGVKIGSNISNSSGTISLSKANVTGALGYTPLQTAPVTSVNGQTGAVTVAEMGWIGEKTYTAYGYGTYTYTLTRDGYGRVSDFKYTHRDCDCTC